MASKSSLAVFLSKLKVFENPNIKLEQYPTDSDVAADMLWNAFMNEDIEGKTIADFGCGTGILGIGALLLGAKKVYFVDIDKDAIKILKQNLDIVRKDFEIDKMEENDDENNNYLQNSENFASHGGGGYERSEWGEQDGGRIEIINNSIENFNKKIDIVLQNPPFGTKTEHADKAFLETAFKITNTIYSFHKTSTKKFIEAICKDYNFEVGIEYKYNFPLKKTMQHHAKKIERIEVSCFRLKKIQNNDQEKTIEENNKNKNKKTDFISELKKLSLPKNEFAIFGSGPLAIRGLKEINDIDIIVKKNLWEELCKKYPKKQGRNDCILIGEIEVFDKWMAPYKENETDMLIDTADIIDGIRYVKLEHVLLWKLARNSEKDQKDIAILSSFLEKN